MPKTQARPGVTRKCSCGRELRRSKSRCYVCAPRKCSICHVEERQGGCYCEACANMLKVLHQLHGGPDPLRLNIPGRAERIVEYRERAAKGKDLFV